MKLKELFKKIEIAREIAEMTDSTSNYSIYVEIDGITQCQWINGYSTIWFKYWKDFIKAVKEDWNENVVKALENGKLHSQAVDGRNENIFSVENDFDSKIIVGVCH